MDCKYFGECGACVVYENGYDAQLKKKLDLNKERFLPFFDGEILVFESPQLNYRSRCEFKLWHVGDEIFYAMNNKDKSKKVVLIDSCPQANIHINILMPKLIKLIKTKNIDFKLFGIDFLSSQNGEIVVSFLYHRKLDEDWLSIAKEIAKELNIYIIGRSRKQKLVVTQDYITESLNIEDKEYRFNYIENSFSQPNAKVNEKMISWIINSLEKNNDDLLELYCGAGNFTIPFATKFNKVLATEISKSSINAAKTNMELNDIYNIEFVRMSVEEFTQALDGVREFRRMKDVDIDRYNFSTIFVDPPRSGMDSTTSMFSARYDNILYISCNPESLVRDLEIIYKTHDIIEMALFDQFPYTHHVEMGVKLKRRV